MFRKRWLMRCVQSLEKHETYFVCKEPEFALDCCVFAPHTLQCDVLTHTVSDVREGLGHLKP